MQVTGSHYLQQVETYQHDLYNSSNVDQLKIYLSSEKFSLIVLEEGEVKLSKVYYFKETSSTLYFIDLLKEIFLKESDLFDNLFYQIEIFYQTPDFTFIPEALYEENDKAKYLSFNTNPNNLIPFEHAIDSLGIKVIFGIESKLYAFLIEKFNDFEIKFAPHNIIEYFKDLSEEQAIYIFLENNTFDLCIIDKKTLQYYNLFEFSNIEEFAYYVLFVMEQYGLNPENINVKILSEEPDKENYFDILYQYIRNVDMIEKENVNNAIHFNSINGLLKLI